jgi:hypothetical protein
MIRENRDQASSVTTDADRYYLVVEQEAGSCNDSCAAPGYEMPPEYPVTLAAGESVILDFSLVPVSQQN